MPLEGIDYAWGRPSIVSLQAGGFHFACRYLSHDTSGKNLDHAEAVRLTNGNIWIVVVFEQTADRMLAGFSQGSADAVFAAAQAQGCGMPEGRPIYFACDFDATAGQQSAINAYLDGAAAQIGRERVGIYGGIHPVSRALDAGKIHWAWQTYAWSGGVWDSRAQIQQYHNDIVVDGVGCDRDRAMIETHPDYGQWQIGAVPDMALTSADIKAVAAETARQIWAADTCPTPDPGDPNNPTWTHENVLRLAYSRARDALNAANAAISAVNGSTTEIHLAKNEILAALAALPTPTGDTAAIVSGVLAGIDPAVLAEHIANELGPGLAAEVLDALRDRLQS